MRRSLLRYQKNKQHLTRNYSHFHVAIARVTTMTTIVMYYVGRIIVAIIFTRTFFPWPTTHMPAGICIIYRRIVDIRIPIIPLDPSRHNRIGLREASQGGVIPARVVEILPKITAVGVLSRVGVFGGSCPVRVARLSPRFVAQFGNQRAIAVGGN